MYYRPTYQIQVTATDGDKDRPQNIVYFLTGQGIDPDNPSNSKFDINRTTGEIFVLKVSFQKLFLDIYVEYNKWHLEIWGVDFVFWHSKTVFFLFKRYRLTLFQLQSKYLLHSRPFTESNCSGIDDTEILWFKGNLSIQENCGESTEFPFSINFLEESGFTIIKQNNVFKISTFWYIMTHKTSIIFPKYKRTENCSPTLSN